MTPAERVKAEETCAKKEMSLLMYRLQNLPTASRARLQATFANQMVSETISFETPRGPLRFTMLGKEAAVRAATALDRQPATIAWIDGFKPGGVFWDIGANVGTYALYAGLRGDTAVMAFEPAAVNYFLLSANIEANELSARVDALLLGLSDGKSLARLEVSQFQPARSFSFKGKAHKPQPGRQASLLLSMDQLLDEYGLRCPNYIKIDVPGLSEAILAGGERLLRRHELLEIHIEASDDQPSGERIVRVLASAGFRVAGRADHGSQDVPFTRP